MQSAAGVAVELEPGVVRVIAPNPSPMTHWGTNSYLVGETGLALIDPGPDLPAHAEALLAALKPGQAITHILCTHSHLDHSPLAARLSARTGAPVHAFGTHLDGRRPVMQALAESGLAGGGEGIDAGFAPDIRLAHGDVLAGPGWQLTALHTPGHIANHLSFALARPEGEAVFTGDHVMGWASSLISPPDGDVTAFMASLALLAGRPSRIYHPGHGAAVTDPAARLAWLASHRRARESQVLAALAAGPASPPELTARVYTDVPPALLPAAERNLLAQLVALAEQGAVTASPTLSASATYALA
ncbi:MBL fold metallo-hydrolase [Vannielia litorea]|uniref:Hydroxyacylglutathione hydrolase n=1 Tax=Vannielia litorea TaxID=1217970 RepID=A0A1N6FM03_9RHOB|nr:MBL fold metallo-hydrolase [Vannielia litorea]SIN96220.1 hydroxyacylglutathione hydrolase [Vannielia litorea]